MTKQVEILPYLLTKNRRNISCEDKKRGNYAKSFGNSTSRIFIPVVIEFHQQDAFVNENERAHDFMQKSEFCQKEAGRLAMNHKPDIPILLLWPLQVLKLFNT